MLLGHEGGRRPSRRDRLVFAAERLVETAQEGGVEAGGEHRARQVEHVGDAVEPDIGKRRDGLRVEAERRERERRKRVPHRAGRDDEEMLVLVIPGRGRSPASPKSILADRGYGFRASPFGLPRNDRHSAPKPVSGDAPGAAGRARNRDARAQTLGGEARHDIAAKRRLSAEQMRAAGDVEHDARGGIDPDQRGIAVAPIGDRLEQPPVRRGIALRDLQRGMARARIGERRADREAQARGRIVHRGDPQRALDHVHDDDRRVLIRRGCAPCEPVRRQPPQPDREMTGRRGRRAHGDPRTRASGPWARGGF